MYQAPTVRLTQFVNLSAGGPVRGLKFLGTIRLKLERLMDEAVAGNGMGQRVWNVLD